MDGPNVHVPYGDLVYNLTIKQGHGDQNGHSVILVFIRKIRRLFGVYFTIFTYGDLVYNLKIIQGHGDQNGHSFILVFIH